MTTPQATIRALVDTTDGRRIDADIPIRRTVKLGCGCTRYSGTRPGPVGVGCPGVHVLDGRCGRHAGPLDPDHPTGGPA